MMQPDLQRIAHIRDYCVEIQKTIVRYGDTFEHLIATQTISVQCPFQSCKFESSAEDYLRNSVKLLRIECNGGR